MDGLTEAARPGRWLATPALDPAQSVGLSGDQGANTLATRAQAGAASAPAAPLRSQHWNWLNGRGGRTPSRVACTSVPRERARSASARTQCDFAAAFDHRTRTALAPRKRSSIASAKAP